MLVTDVEDDPCWRQLWDVGDGFDNGFFKDVTNIAIRSSWFTCHQHLCSRWTLKEFMENFHSWSNWLYIYIETLFIIMHILNGFSMRHTVCQNYMISMHCCRCRARCCCIHCQCCSSFWWNCCRFSLEWFNCRYAGFIEQLGFGLFIEFILEILIVRCWFVLICCRNIRNVVWKPV